MKLPFWPDPKKYRDIDLGLERVNLLLSRIGNPHLKLPPVIHIAGTNGKGSTLSFLRQIFQEANFTTHAYISPHLVNFNERIILADKKISDKFLNEILLECQKAAEKSPAIDVTFFEGITVAAFLAFSRIKADILLLETGMGGRLDATNILPEVLCSIITPIAFDHTDFLGKTLAKIAFEKAGIIKKNSLVIVGKQKISASKTIKNQALKLRSKTKFFGQDWQVKKSKKSWQYIAKNHAAIDFPLPSLSGDHQVENASVAITAAIACKKFKITNNHIKSALTKTFWPARLQKITSGKFFKILPENYELYLDGSHNLQGCETIKKFLKLQKNKKVFVIFSMLKDKDCEGFLKKISGEIDKLYAIEIPDEPKSRSALEIQKIASKVGIKSSVAIDFEEAFADILKSNKLNKNSVIMVCGSLYLAGNFLSIL